MIAAAWTWTYAPAPLTAAQYAGWAIVFTCIYAGWLLPVLDAARIIARYFRARGQHRTRAFPRPDAPLALDGPARATGKEPASGAKGTVPGPVPLPGGGPDYIAVHRDGHVTASGGRVTVRPGGGIRQPGGAR